VHVRGRVHESPFVFSYSCGKAFNVTGGNGQQRTGFGVSGYFFEIEVRVTEVLDGVPHTNDVEFSRSEIVVEEVGPDGVEL